MTLIPWEESYALGISEIDTQHQKMLAIINKLNDLYTEKKQENQEEINKIIQEMSDYAVYHFQSEERYFHLFGYDKMDEHIQIHDQYRSKVEDWRKRYDADKDAKIFFEIMNYLQDWWIWHINNTDREYVPLFKENGVK